MTYKCFYIVIIVWILFFGQSFRLYSQSSDNKPDTSPVISHSPKKAALLSVVLPGLGQAYNKKYWKIPVLYAGIGTLVYFIIDNNRQYLKYKNAYLAETSGNPNTDPFGGRLDTTELLYYKDEFRRYRDLDIILAAGLYALNIIDANVDAHFFDYDISPDLSLKLEPTMFTFDQRKKSGLGFHLFITFK
ncbi:MAG: DUF5683 domain-containing protein [Bacteroidia bacterium]|nr:DUF5683 domain-containing protein [Bacteroidia bacterium]